MKCYECKRVGHTKVECPNLQRKKEKSFISFILSYVIQSWVQLGVDNLEIALDIARLKEKIKEKEERK